MAALCPPGEQQDFEVGPATALATKEMKQCGHYCYPSNLPGCCSCSDVRPVEDFYENYLDGVGFTKTAERDDHYCGVCNTKNYDKWVERVGRELKRKQDEDAAKLAEEMERMRVEEEDREKAQQLNEDEDQRVEYRNGDVYVGRLKDGKRHGYGRMDYGDNEMDMLSYEGMWKDGLHEGMGLKRWMDDMWYKGEWKAGMMHGKGICHQNEIDVMEGLFEEDEFCG